MPTLTKDTKVNTSLVTIFAVLMWLGGMQWKAFGYVAKIDSNAVAVATLPEYITKQDALEMLIAANAQSIELMEVKDVQDTLRSLRKSKRSLESELRRDPDNNYIADDIGDVDDDLEYYEELLDCLRSNKGECE